MKLDVKTSKTGRTETIHEIRTGTTPSGDLSMEVTAGMQMRSEIHLWGVPADELQKTPELRELAAYAGRPKGGYGSGRDDDEAPCPGCPVGEKLRAPLEEIMKAAGGAVIRMRRGNLHAGDGASRGRCRWRRTGRRRSTWNWWNCRSAPIPDSRFEVPAEYQKAPMEISSPRSSRRRNRRSRRPGVKRSNARKEHHRRGRRNADERPCQAGDDLPERRHPAPLSRCTMR